MSMDRSSHHQPTENGNGNPSAVIDRTPTRAPLSIPESTASSTRATERSAVVLALFGPTVGPCVGDFSTTYNRVNGRLYAATRAILFYSNLFGFERRLCLPLSDIESIEAYRSTSIRISMVDCEDHVFRKFFNRDEVLRILKALYEQDNSLDELEGRVIPMGPSDDSTPIRRIPNVENDTENTSIDGSTRDRLASDVSQPETADGGVGKGPRPRSQSVPSMNKLLMLQERTKTDMNLRPRIFRRVQSTLSANRASPVPEILERIPSDSGPSFTAIKGLSLPSEGSSPAPPGFDMTAAWLVAKNPYSEVALNKTTLFCSLEAFMDLFLSNEASFPIARYQKEKIDDKDISYTKWKRRQGPKAIYPPIFDRDINFIHPLNNTVGPSQAKTNRKQCFQRFGTLGATLQNTTTIQGVPGAECFRVEDRWIMESVDEGSVNISVYFQIVFSKRTMFKPIIQKNVKAETKKWFQGYAKFLRHALHEDDKKEGTSPPSPLDASDSEVEAFVDDDQVPRSSWQSSVTIAALFLILGFVGLQILFLQQSVTNVQNQLSMLQFQNEELTALMKHVISSKQC